MTMMTPIHTTPPSVPVPQTAFLAAEQLTAFRAVACEMLADAAMALDTGDAALASIAAGLRSQARLRITGVSLLLGDIVSLMSRENVMQIATELGALSVAPDITGDRVRMAADLIDTLIDLELYQLRLGALYDRYD